METYHGLVPRPIFLANASMALVGSDPIDNNPIIGTLTVDSSHIFSTSSSTPSAYLTPTASEIYLRAWVVVLSGHQLLHTAVTNHTFVDASANLTSSSFLKVSSELL